MQTAGFSLEIYFTFYVRSSVRYQEGGCPIVFRVNYRGERKDIFTGLTCPPAMWLKNERAVKHEYPGSTVINKNLHQILAQAEHHFQRLKFMGEEFTIDDLCDQIRGKTPPPQTLQEYMELKLQEFEKKKKVELSVTTCFKYKRTVRYLNDYIRIEHRNRSIPVSKVDLDFVNGFYKFMRTEKKNAHNSTSAIMGCFKTILQAAIKNKVIRTSPFDSYVMKREQTNRTYLELEELKALEELQNLDSKLTLYRDVFLFACYTGLPYIDLKQLSRSHIHQDNDGSLYIRLTRTKTRIESIIPLLPKAEAILKRYSKTGDCRDFKWKISVNAVFNRYLKTLARLAGIDKYLIVHMGRHTFATTVALTNGVSLESVARMLGHSTTKHTQVYAKVVASKVKNEMQKVKDIFK
jgi:site-specific recombinase XerD